ncbi:MAG: flagellar basal body P-ring protein FlgI, partial [Gammaproteobacteria bacterium]|nr:flagellar basal body P-ring protein FlgI [Gammaproteobacteria bacterium]
MNMMRFFVVSCLLVISTSVAADRLKDISRVQGVRDNPLIGYGLVVGLSGTGDKTSGTPFTTQTFINMMSQFGISVPANLNPKLENVAAVAIHAKLPPFSKPGQLIDITVSSIGNSKSLRGGSLLMTPLKGADGQVYAVAQGNLVVGGFGAEGSDGSKITVNVPSV